MEHSRWSGSANFGGGSKAMLPQSINGELRRGADQAKMWSEVARNNRALNAENATGNLDEALQAAPVKKTLDAVRRQIVPAIPQGTTGFIFVDHGRPLGLELLGSEQLARQLLPKLLDSYAVDYVILGNAARDRENRRDNRVAIALFERVCRAGSQRASTPGSGSGIRVEGDNLLGDGVSLDSTLVHCGVQVQQAVAQPPRRGPVIIYPNSNQGDVPDQRPPLVR